MRVKNKRLIYLLLIFLFSNLVLTQAEELDPKYKYITGYAPTPSRPHRRAGGESYPPLPLPVVPMRRTEKKRPPSPPILMAKLQYGQGNQWVGYGNNAQRLVLFANSQLGVQYRAVEVHVNNLPLSPENFPILFATGLVSFSLPEERQKQLREYLIAGGTLLLDCNSGHYEIKDSFLKLIKQMFPNTPLRPLPPDHPVYYSHYRIKKAKYYLAPSDPRIYNPNWRGSYSQPKATEGPPLLYGLDIGSRTVIFLSTYDLGCGWVKKVFPFGNRYTIEDALKLGTNMVAYTLQFYPIGKYLSLERAYKLEDSSYSDLYLAQVIHSGYWDPATTQLSRLLKVLREETTSLPNLKAVQIPLVSNKVFDYPLLYLTGHDSFSLSELERANLRQYLQRDGFLFVENRCGRSVFDADFRKEMTKVLPGAKLIELSPDEKIFSCFYNISKVSYSPWVGEFPQHKGEVYLEGIKIGDNYQIIYSKYDLAWGWETEVYPPYTRGVIGADSYKLATNIIVYSLTH